MCIPERAIVKELKSLLLEIDEIKEKFEVLESHFRVKVIKSDVVNVRWKIEKLPLFGKGNK